MSVRTREIRVEEKSECDHLAYLRSGAQQDPNPLASLKEAALHSRDQRTQVAALTGLEKHRSAEAALVIAERLMNPWGMAALTRAIEVLGRSFGNLGLAILSATFFMDERFFLEKWDAVMENAIASGDKGTATAILELGDPDEIRVHTQQAAIWLEVFVESGSRNVRNGALFGAQFHGLEHSRRFEFREPDRDELSKAIEYVESMLPGLKAAFEGHLQRRWAST